MHVLRIFMLSLVLIVTGCSDDGYTASDRSRDNITATLVVGTFVGVIVIAVLAYLSKPETEVFRREVRVEQPPVLRQGTIVGGQFVADAQAPIRAVAAPQRPRAAPAPIISDTDDDDVGPGPGPGDDIFDDTNPNEEV